MTSTTKRTTTTTTTTATTTKPKVNPAIAFREQLLAEEPKLDAGLKSFCSWIVASASTASSLDKKNRNTTTTTAAATTNDDDDDDDDASTEPSPAWTLTTALTCTRQLSRAINAHIVPIQFNDDKNKKNKNNHATEPITTPEELMEEVTAQVWNEVAAQPDTKITKVLGRTALQRVWKDLDLTTLTSTAAGTSYCHLFYELLMENRQRTVTISHSVRDATPNNTTVSDADLIWGGPQAVTRRAVERQAIAAKRVQEAELHQQQQLQQAMTGPIIEELSVEEDEKDANTEPSAIE